MKKIKYTSYLVTAIWIINAFITMGSIIISYIGWTINVVVSIIFVLISIYVFFKEKNFVLLISQLDLSNGIQVKRAIRYEFLFLLITLLAGIIVLSAVYHRGFIENFTVLG